MIAQNIWKFAQILNFGLINAKQEKNALISCICPNFTKFTKPSGPMLSISRNVHMCVCVCGCLCVFFTFEIPFKRLFAPTSRSWMSQIFRDSESLGKSNENKWSQIWKLLLIKGVVFSPTRPHWAELVIESPCPFVVLCVCLCHRETPTSGGRVDLWSKIAFLILVWDDTIFKKRGGLIFSRDC